MRHALHQPLEKVRTLIITMSNSSHIETREIDDTALDNVAGGLSGAAVTSLAAGFTQDLGGVAVVEGFVTSDAFVAVDAPLSAGPITV